MTAKSLIRLSTLAAVIGCLVTGVQSANAQTAETPKSPIARSQELQRNAQDMFTTPDHWQDAAALLTHAARLRPVGDPEKQRMLATAARLYAYRGNAGLALYWMQRGAEQALAGGDVLTAAQTFTEAAYLAGDRGDWGKVKQLAQRVATLAGSPLLSADQRESIMRPFAQGLASTGAAAPAGQNQ